MLKHKDVHTQFGRADEVADSTHTAVILALWLIQLNSHPLTTSKLSGSTETKSACLIKKTGYILGQINECA